MRTIIVNRPKPAILMTILISASLLLSACTAAISDNQDTPTPNTPAPQQGSGDPTPGSPFISVDESGRLTPDAVILELAYEPTFSRLEASYEYGRPPVFALLADGRVIYSEEGASSEDERIMVAKLTPQEMSDLIQKVSDLGIENLESYTDFCKNLADGTQSCLADAAYTILRTRTAADGLKEVKIYGNYANDEQAFTSITEFLGHYSRPDAAQYVPAKAGLFLSKNSSEVSVEAKEWPLEPSLQEYPLNDMGLWAIVLEGKPLSDYLAAAERNVGDSFFEENGTVYRAYLVPWLPGADYTTELQADFPPQ